MKALRKQITGSLFIALMVLAGCGKTDTSDTDNNIVGPKENVIVPDNEVKETKLVTYPGPSLFTSSDLAKVEVDNEDIFVYETRVNHRRSFTWDYSQDKAPVALFDFEGKVHVKITVPSDVTSCKVSPMDYGVTPTFSGKVIEFDLDTPTNYVVEYNDDSKTAIHLFTSMIEEDPITEEEAKKDENILYFGPGVYKVDSLPLHSNQTIYLAGGSYLYGQALAADLENITIRGRGIIDGEIYERRSASEKEIPIELQRCKNIKIEGVTILDPAGWAIAMIDSTDIKINDVKIISARSNGDGISLQSCKNTYVKGGFVRSWDDSLVVKNVNRGTTKDITFDGVSVWTDLAQSMEVGYETNGPTMDNITFKNITVIHNFHKACMSIHNCDDATITGVHFENITLEDGSMLGDVQDDGLNDFLIDMTIAYNIEWTKSEGKRGKVKDVTFKNIRVDSLKDTVLCRMEGESEDSSIDNVSFENIQIQGKKANSEKELKMTKNQFVNNVTYKDNKETAGAILTLPYKNTSDGSNPSITKKEGKEQTGILVPELLRQPDNLAYIGEKVPLEKATVSVTHGKGTTNKAEYDDKTGDYASGEANKLIDNDRSKAISFKDYVGQDDEFIAVTIEFHELVNLGVIRLLEDKNNEIYHRYNISLYGRKMKSDGVTENPNFIRLLSASDYESTPTSGSYFDMNFTATKYLALQLRFFRKKGVGYSDKISISEIEFYQPSLTYNKAIVYSTEHSDVYNVERLVDGNKDGTSYYESKTLPAEVVIDMGELHTLNCLVMFLPGNMAWTTRTQEVEFYYSDSINDFNKNTTKFNALVEKKAYTFNPETGNMNKIDVKDKNVKARYIKLVVSSNDASGNYGAQLSEFNVYGK